MVVVSGSVVVVVDVVVGAGVVVTEFGLVSDYTWSFTSVSPFPSYLLFRRSPHNELLDKSIQSP